MGGGGKSLITNELASYTEVLDNGMGAVEIEAIPETPENEEYLASLGLTSSVKDDDLPNGTKYTILAYKKTGNSYTFDKKQTFTVGQNSEIKLDHGQSYTLILISNGTSTSPNIYNEKEIHNANILNNDANPKVLYQRIDNFIPNGNINNKINVKLIHKAVSIRIIIDSSDILGGNMGRNITHIKNPVISYRRRDWFELAGAVTVVGEAVTIAREVKGFGTLKRTVVSSDNNDDLKVETGTEATFHIKFKIENMGGERDLNIALKNIKLGYRHVIRVKLNGCGAYLDLRKTNWRQFMCHNLGADYTKDPFIPSAEIHGDKYQWGYAYPIVKQKDDIYTGSIPNWNRVTSGDTWNNGIDDPCPSGYGVPSKSDWTRVLRYNKKTKIGNWSSQPYPRSATTGIMIGDNLILPTAGSFQNEGKVWSDYVPGAYASYWSSRELYEPEIYQGIGGEASDAVVFFSDKDGGILKERIEFDGMSVRCIRNR